MQTLIWRHFRLEHPEDWEMLHYSCNTAVGRCALADRYRFRLEFHWRQFAVEPDLDRIMSDYRKDLVGEDDTTAVRQLQHGAWRGLEKAGEGILTWRFGRFFGGERCLVEVVLVWPQGTDEALAHRILDSVREEPAQRGTRRWRAFGMDMGVTEGLAPRECTIESARARIVFGTAKPSGQAESFQRLGMVRQWLGGTVADWLGTQRPSNARAWRRDDACRSDHELHGATAELPATGLGRVLRRRGVFEAAAWICPTDERLYAVTRTSNEAPASGGAGLAGRRLACCPGLASAS